MAGMVIAIVRLVTQLFPCWVGNELMDIMLMYIHIYIVILPIIFLSLIFSLLKLLLSCFLLSFITVHIICLYIYMVKAPGSQVKLQFDD